MNCGKKSWLLDEAWPETRTHILNPSHRRRDALLSADADINTNPYEVGLGRLVDLEMDADFVGKDALKKIYQTGVSRQLVGIEFDGAPLTGPNTTFWQIHAGIRLSARTSAVYSPRLQKNIALAMVSTSHTDIGTALVIDTKADIRNAEVCEKPFFDPKKKLAVVGGEHMIKYAQIRLNDSLPCSIGTYGTDDIIPDAHVLDMVLYLDKSWFVIDADQMDRVFDYDPLIRKFYIRPPRINMKRRNT